jgi:hypothetical protein
MPLKYSLIDNPMTADPDDRMAMTSVNQSFELGDVIDEMISRGSTVTRAEALSVFDELCLAIERLVENGNSVVTPLFNIAPSLVGVFTNDDDSFDRSRHQVKLRIRPGLRLRQMEQNIAVEKVPPTRLQPVLVHFFDNTSESQDEVITPGGGGRIVGSLLKFDEADTQQGLFFVNVGNGSAIRVSGKFLKNKPGELIFIIPNLPPALYRVEVRAIKPGTKGLRTGVLPFELTVSGS